MARSFAAALDQPAAAASLREILRASPYVRHRVDLADLSVNPRAAALIAAAARASHVGDEDFRRYLGEQKQLAIAVTLEFDRKTWDGRPGAWVAARLNEEPAPTTMYGPGGSIKATATVKTLALHPGHPVVVIIQPYHVLARRATIGPDSPQGNISAPDEDWRGSASIDRLASGRQKITQLNGYLYHVMGASSAPTPVGGGALFSSTPPDTTFINTWWTVDGNDEGEINPHLEFEFHFEYRSRGDNSVKEDMWINHTTTNWAWDDLNMPVLLRKPDAAGFVEGEILEDDGWGGTDHYTPDGITIQNETPNYYSRSDSHTHPWFVGGDHFKCDELAHQDIPGHPIFWQNDVNQVVCRDLRVSRL